MVPFESCPPLPQNWGFATQLPPLISGTGKSTDFKFGGYIYRGYPNKRPLKILEKRERGRFQGLPKFFGYPLLSQEHVKLRTSNFVGTFIGSIGTKAHDIVGNSGRGRIVRESRKLSARAPICRAHCAIIFAIAQLSCCCSSCCYQIFHFLKLKICRFSIDRYETFYTIILTTIILFESSYFVQAVSNL